MNHLLHATLPEGSLLEIAPATVEIGQLEDGGYIVTIADEALTVRVALSDDDFVKVIRSAADKLDNDGHGSGKIEVAKVIPAPFAGKR